MSIIYVAVPSKGVFTLQPDGSWKVDERLLKLLAEGHVQYPQHVYISPSVQNYALLPHLPSVGADYESWKERCRTILRMCDVVHVYCFPDWEKSVGVKDELEIANALGLPIVHIDVTEEV